MHPVKTKLILLCFLSIILLNVDSIAQIKTLKNNSPASLDFSCAGDYMEIDGKKYFNNGTVFYCSTTGIGFTVEIFAYQENGSAYPAFTQWEFIPPPFPYNLGSTFSGNKAYISGDLYAGAVNHPIIAKAFFMDGQALRSVSVNVVFTRVAFKEHENQMYGFDENKSAESSYSSYFQGIAWKSVLLNGSDVFKAEMAPPGVHPYITIHSGDGQNFPVAPDVPNTNPQDVTVEGGVPGSTYVYAKAGQNGPCEQSYFNSQVNMVAYPLKNKTVKFFLLEGDDANDISAAAAHSTLNEIYHDAVFDWAMSPVEIVTIEVNYDADGDGMVDIPEMQAIVEACCPWVEDVRYVIFVDAFDFPPGLATYPFGFTLPGLGTSFVWTMQPAEDVYETVAHELGHTLGLQHPFEDFSGHFPGKDPDNFMDYYKFINANGELISAPHTAKIRKYHWEELRN